jgi:hypothetical protein
MTNQNYLAYDVTVLEREFADLLAAYPELAEDEELRADTIEGETDAHRILARIVAVERDADSMAKAIADRARDLAGRRARHERKKEAMRVLLLRLLKAAGLPKVALPEATVSVSEGRDSVEIVDADALPAELVRVERIPDKKAILDVVKGCGEIPGARLVTGGETLTVRAA